MSSMKFLLLDGEFVVVDGSSTWLLSVVIVCGCDFLKLILLDPLRKLFKKFNETSKTIQ